MTTASSSPRRAQRDRFFERGRGGARRFKRRLGRLALRSPADDDVIGRLGHASGCQSEIDNLRPDAGAIAEGDADAKFLPLLMIAS